MSEDLNEFLHLGIIALRYGDNIVMAVRATGGYKYRELLPGDNAKKDESCVKATTLVYEALIKNAILEKMLQDIQRPEQKLFQHIKRAIREWKRRKEYRHPFELYQERFIEVVKQINAKGEAAKK